MVKILVFFGEKLYYLARGIDDRPVISERIRKSISVEETYLQDLSIENCIKNTPELLKKLASRIENEKNLPPIHNVFIKLKFNNFQQITVERVADKIFFQ